MTIPAFKAMFYVRPEGTPLERRIYITISLVTWVGVYALHRPVGLFDLRSPPWLQFVGICRVLLAVLAFFEFATFEGLARMVAVPASELSHPVGAETPLMKDGPLRQGPPPDVPGGLLARFRLAPDPSPRGRAPLRPADHRLLRGLHPLRRAPARQGPSRGVPLPHAGHALSAPRRNLVGGFARSGTRRDSAVRDWRARQDSNFRDESGKQGGPPGATRGCVGAR